jgi:hypothetical protein
MIAHLNANHSDDSADRNLEMPILKKRQHEDQREKHDLNASEDEHSPPPIPPGFPVILTDEAASNIKHKARGF